MALPSLPSPRPALAEEGVPEDDNEDHGASQGIPWLEVEDEEEPRDLEGEILNTTTTVRMSGTARLQNRKAKVILKSLPSTLSGSMANHEHVRPGALPYTNVNLAADLEHITVTINELKGLVESLRVRSRNGGLDLSPRDRPQFNEYHSPAEATTRPASNLGKRYCPSALLMHSFCMQHQDIWCTSLAAINSMVG
jgi:hypothetical protein